jgi:hypothetical protein
MAYGMKIYNADNTLAYDSTSKGGVFVRYVVLPAGTTYIDTRATVPFGMEYASKTITIFPLVLGSHYWYWFPGSVEGNQTPELSWYDERYMAPSVQRKNTILMVFAK